MQRILTASCVLLLGASAAFAATIPSYPPKTAPVAADKIPINDSADSWKVKSATLSSLANAWDSITLSATSPLALNTSTGVLSFNVAAIDTQAEFEAWVGWSIPSTGGASALTDLTDWPDAVSATEVGYLDGVTSSIQAQINGLSVGSLPSVSSDPAAPDDGYAWFNTTDHTLNVAQAAGTTKFTGAFTAWDLTPTAFSFTDETDVALNTVKTSNAITVAGINHATTISVTGDTGFGYSKNSAACTSAGGTVALGDTVAACVTSSGSNSTATSATVGIGGVTDTYSVTTAGAAGPFLSDTFTEASLTVLTSHTPETGSSWTELDIAAAQTFNVGAGTGRVTNSGTDGDIALNAVTPPSADYTTTIVTGTTASVATDRLWGACVRVQADKSAYCARLSASGSFVIAEYAAGGTSVYGTALTFTTYTIPTNTEFTISLTASGSSLSATLEGYGTISTSDSTITSAGYAGFLLRRNDNGGITSIEAQ